LDAIRQGPGGLATPSPLLPKPPAR
jgi:hypothetical protein